MRRFLTGLLLTALAPPALAQTGTPQATTLRLYTPFQPGGGLLIGVAVTGRASGSCFAASVATSARPDAYRCSAGNAILDPCFASLGDRAPLACSRDPWSANAVLLTVNKALPSNAKLAADPDYARSMPWALELANGQRCTLLTGATAPVAGLRINYGCPDGGVVAGGIDRTLPLWRVFYQTGNRSLSLTQVGVNVAWY
ncbi:hypothetical protein E5F05_02955 (plasmid) [Deinococcus metallilatus]|uniref:Uncharacterized protein n=1 Tax=Deinococcus metallilatus TaxID=1211322 RepID=A0AAJ5K6Y3_9DEIO|nr:hypothetical protein [Deinococcus metallilatus]MBB5295638.1 hypothetical protein [Deinococcus metallilatus]QBY06901.1 hypothetical protein E5F05_02955 [Deinococcus metallilatus]TLK32291.1 hypothetical protein FCS05_02290 [Deinococcus metallilatus]GMA14167.1 hypothetical protein GCM10025871_04980 [Deinococcus metallilatus]